MDKATRNAQIEQEADYRSPERGTADEHRAVNTWLRSNMMSEREILLHVHTALIDILAALEGKK